MTAAAPGIQRSQWRVIILSSLGGALEFYDFVIYSMFAQYIGAAFFPATSQLESLMYSFSVFAVGYLARPLGGVVFSHFGDKYGRRRVFIISILAMSAAAICMGLLPSQASIGSSASVLMDVLSLLVHETLAEPQISAWGWRIGFLFGGLLGLISFWLRLSLEETPEFQLLRKRAASKMPFIELLRSHPAQVATGISAMVATAGFNGLLFAMPAFLPRVMGYSAVEAIQAQNECLVILSFGLLTAAWLGDRIPRRWILGTGGLVLLVSSIPFFTAAANHSMNLLLLFAFAGVGASLVNGPMCGVAADLYPSRIRFSGVAISFNLAFSIFSCIAPLAASFLVAKTGSPVGPAYYMCFCALLTLTGSLFLHRYDGRNVHDSVAANGPAAEAGSFPAQ